MKETSARPIFSVIIATFNSTATLPLVLRAVADQEFEPRDLEILIVDGGSTDATLDLARAAGARVLDNPRTEPVYAKFLGLHAARGRYAIYLDHDEVFVDPRALRKRLRLFESNPDLRALVGSGYRNPEGYPVINRYINDYGDPFSFFIYRMSKDARTFPTAMDRRYGHRFASADGLVIEFDRDAGLPLIELCALGSTLDLEFLRTRLVTELSESTSLPHLFYLMMERTTLLGITKDDPILHFSAESWGRYRNKIKWRIKNNIYHARTMGQAGFSGRQKFFSRWTTVRKVLFLPYALTLIGPLVDALIMCVRNRDSVYLVHVPLTVYTGYTIAWHSLLNVLGFRPALRSYDESKVIVPAEEKI